jgi:hypothetical protein
MKTAGIFKCGQSLLKQSHFPAIKIKISAINTKQNNECVMRERVGACV